MTMLLIAAAALLAGWLLPCPWHRRVRRSAHRQLGVPTAAETAAAITRALDEHEAHSRGHAPWPPHLADRALLSRAKAALAEQGFTHAPIDLAAQLRKAKARG